MYKVGLLAYVTFIWLTVTFWTVHLVTCGALHMCIVLLERKFVLIDQNSFTHRMHSHEGEGGRDFRPALPTHEALRFLPSSLFLPPPPLSIYLYLSLSPPLSRPLPGWCIERKFFSFSKEALGCLFKAVGLYCAFKRKRYIIEQPPSTDTLESRHRPTVLPRAMKFLANRQKPERNGVDIGKTREMLSRI